ncbi:MAG: glycoside hydrolase family 2 [Porphyromonadaceae bacterium]|nr:glycoside hydrolase family 2 [Porphyromonadaceae bacterium]
MGKSLFRVFLVFNLFFILNQSVSGNPVSLNGQWMLHFWPQPETPVTTPQLMRSVNYKTIPASVPGNVELDLQKAGLIKDPMIGGNVWDMRPYEGYQWCFERNFPTPGYRQDQKVMLWFGGIDCLTDIWLNGTKVGSTENMLIEYSFDVTDLLEKDKENLLQVIIRSAVIEAQNYRVSPLEIKGGDANIESLHIRKAPHMYGWDIMPRLVSAGLWRDVELRLADPVRITDVFWMTTKTNVEKRSADMIVDYQLKIPFDQLSKLHAILTLKKNGKEVLSRSERVLTFASRFRFTINNADLWWPRGYGDPALYEGELSIVDEKGNMLASDKRNIGLRTVKLNSTELTTPEKPGEFCFIVNGEKIFIKGTNWVPLDALHSRDSSHLPDAMKMAVDLNCNMLRCWGGNVYEDHAFYDLCDQNGIMVWQDFSMACTTPPQTDDFISKIKKEVESVVLKLRNHPSLSLWAGNNENDASLYWQLSDLRINPNKEIISRRVIPEILFDLDPTRPYLPSSPYYTQAYYDADQQVNLLPERHLWGPRGYYKASFYTDVNAHFVSEIGYHGCPNRESLEKMFDKDFVYPWKKGTFEWNEQWQIKAVRGHEYANNLDGRNNLMLNQIKELFGEVPTDLDRFIFASQSVQAEAKKFFIEFWRSAKFKRTGILWWNLRDGWPIISDAITDYYGGKKLAYYYIKRVQQDACVMITDAHEGNHSIVAVNDSRTEKQGTVSVKDLSTMKVLFSDQFVIPVNGKTIIGHIPENDKQSMWLIEYKIGDEKFINHYLAGKAPFKLEDYEKWCKHLAIERY